MAYASSGSQPRQAADITA